MNLKQRWTALDTESKEMIQLVFLTTVVSGRFLTQFLYHVFSTGQWFGYYGH